MRSASRAAAMVLAVTVGAGAAGCQDVPRSADKKDFCSAGERFSASKTFKQGVSSAKRLSEIGTPAGIPKSARNGFVQLIERVLDAKDGQDFIARSKKLTAQERANLKALDAYVKKTCTA